MDKVFAVIEQTFFVSHGVDYAMPLDEQTDIDLFSVYDDAKKFFEDCAEEISRDYNVDFVTVADEDNYKVVRWNRINGIRKFLKLIEKTVNNPVK